MSSEYPTIVAVVGGDDRAARAPWPKWVDVRHYASAQDGGRKVYNQLGSVHWDRFSLVVVLTRWAGHGLQEFIKSRSGRQPLLWDRGVNECAKMVAAKFPKPIGGVKADFIAVDELLEEPVAMPAVTIPSLPFNVALKNALDDLNWPHKRVAEFVGLASGDLFPRWIKGDAGPSPRLYGRLLSVFPELAHHERPPFRGAGGRPLADKFIEDEIEIGRTSDPPVKEERQPPADKPPPVIPAHIKSFNREATAKFIVEASEAVKPRHEPAPPLPAIDDVEKKAAVYARAARALKEAKTAEEAAEKELERRRELTIAAHDALRLARTALDEV